MKRREWYDRKRWPKQPPLPADTPARRAHRAKMAVSKTLKAVVGFAVSSVGITLVLMAFTGDTSMFQTAKDVVVDVKNSIPLPAAVGGACYDGSTEVAAVWDATGDRWPTRSDGYGGCAVSAKARPFIKDGFGMGGVWDEELRYPSDSDNGDPSSGWWRRVDLRLSLDDGEKVLDGMVWR